MLHLRPYKSCDSLRIAEWIKDKDIFLKWGGDRFGEFPISAEIIDDKYRIKNGDCPETDRLILRRFKLDCRCYFSKAIYSDMIKSSQRRTTI